MPKTKRRAIKAVPAPKGSKNNLAKYAFYYLLSLVALIFTALSTGMIIFQLINKKLNDSLNFYNYDFSADSLKFAVSAMIIAAPIFYIISRYIYKGLHRGELDKDSGLRKWLTYFILFVCSVIVIGCLIGVLNNFFNGDLTTKFILKMATAIFIPIVTFSFYFYDIRRTKTEKKDPVVRAYFWGSLVLVLVTLVSGLMIVESPKEARARRFDEQIMNNFATLSDRIGFYYQNNNQLPANLSVLETAGEYGNFYADPETGKAFDYKIIGKNTYELCAVFRRDNNEPKPGYSNYYGARKHNAGYQCLDYTAPNIDGKNIPANVTPAAPAPVPALNSNPIETPVPAASSAPAVSPSLD